MFGLLIVGSAAAIADLQLIDQFDDRPLGEIAPQPDWSGTAGTGMVEVDPDDSQNRLLAVRTNSGILRRPLSIPDGSGQTLFFRLRFGDQQNYSIGLSRLTNPVEFSDFSPEIGMASAAKTLRVWEGDLGHYTDIATLEADKWYNVWVSVSTADDSFQIWINDRECEGAVGADQLDNDGDTSFGFRSGVGSAGLQSFYIKTGGGSSGMGASDGPVFIDDIYLDDGAGTLNLQNPTSARDDYREDFESGSTRGWDVHTDAFLQTVGGVGDTAYLRGTREGGLAPIFLPTSDAAGRHLLGNLSACFGNEIRFSYYGRSFAGLADPIQHNFFIAPLHATSTIWTEDVASGSDFLTDWHKIEFYIDAAWSDSEAQTHGWSRLRGSDSWAETLANVVRNEFFKGTGNSGTQRVAGIDNILVEPSPIPVNGLVAYYPFDGSAEDASGEGNPGSVTGATLVEDAGCTPDGAYDFDGDGDLISIPGFSGAPTSGTIAAWVTVESFDTGFNQLNLIFGQDDNLQLGLGDGSIGADGLWVFGHRSTDMNNAIGPAPELNKWTHVAGVWTGTEAILYIDGAEAARVASGALAAAVGAARIGAHPSAAQNYWEGQIDEVLLYDRALDPDEIATLAATVSYSDEQPEIISLQVVNGLEAVLQWQPPLERAFIDFSSDLISWEPIAGPLNGCHWTGDLPNGSSRRGFLRVRRSSNP